MSINKYIICKGVLLLLVVVAFAPPAHASVIQLQPNNLGLVGYWSFNDGVGTKAGDSSGFGNTGTLATDGSALPTWTTGKFGKALAFDGINSAGSYVDVAGGGAISKLSGAMTVCAWIKKSTDFTYDNSIITNATVIGSNANTQYDLEVIQTGQVDFAWTTDGSLFETRSSANGLVQAGIWYFLCGVRDAGGSGYIFLNGVDVSFTPVNDPNNVVPAALGGDTLIGRW